MSIRASDNDSPDVIVVVQVLKLVQQLLAHLQSVDLTFKRAACACCKYG
jgi:hypothetical protein